MGNNLKKLRENKGWTQDQAADAMGMSKGGFIKLERGERTLNQKHIDLAAKAFGVSAFEITATAEDSEILEALSRVAAGEMPEPNTDLSQAKDVPNFRGFGGPRDVPVRGTALGGSSDDGDFRFTSDVNLGHEPRPPGIMGRKGIYVVYVQNDSMDPKFEPGDRLYVDPHRPARPMDYVVIELHGHDGESGRGYIKRLVRKTPTRLILEQFNPRREIEFNVDEVKAIHRVIPQDELLGV